MDAPKDLSAWNSERPALGAEHATQLELAEGRVTYRML